MAKQTLYIVSECDLSFSRGSIIITYSDNTKIQRPLEDIATVVIDHHSAHITIPLINALSGNGIAVVFCNEEHMPVSILQDLDGNYVQGHRFHRQLEAGKPLQKQLWQQIVVAKIRNQSALLAHFGKGIDPLKSFYSNVKSGDSTNREGLAAKAYWQLLFGKGFLRDRFGEAPNNILNYGYALLRANVARSLTGAGLLPSIGLFHHNRFDAFPLADDLMEPFRPFVDEKVHELYLAGKVKIDRLLKAEIVQLFYERIPFSTICRAVDSLVRCYEGESKVLLFPSIF